MARSRTTLKPGERVGRRKNIPNKRTAERMEQARLDIENANAAGNQHAIVQVKKKLAKEVLEEFMLLFAGIAAQHQPLPAGADLTGRTPDEALFVKYAELTVTTARALAEFQSPKFRAIQVAIQPGGEASMRDITPARADPDNVHRINDPTAMARVYQQLVRQVR